MIKIGRPYIQKVNRNSRLVAEIELPNVKRVMFFEVDSKYEKYLCTENADAFVVGILNYAMATEQDVISEAPVSSRLLYQIKTYFIPTMPIVRPFRYKSINLIAEEFIGKIENRGAVGASASGGVDSFYSICRHIKDTESKYCLTHLLIANQFNIYEDEESINNQFVEIQNDSRKIAENYGLEMISMYTNHYDFVFDGFVQEYSLRICSYALALQKLFSVYYVSSGVPFKQFGYMNHDSDGFDIFNLSLMSNDMVSFYSSGGEIGRTEKIRYISHDEFVQNNLKVCNDIQHFNCGKCEKCLRTMLSLDILGKLDDFKNSFPIYEYSKRRKKYLAIVEANYLEASSDLLENIKKYGYKVPVSCIVNGRLFLRTMHSIKLILKKWEWLREIYFKMKIDFLIYGREKATVYRYGSKYEIRR